MPRFVVRKRLAGVRKRLARVPKRLARVRKRLAGIRKQLAIGQNLFAFFDLHVNALHPVGHNFSGIPHCIGLVFQRISRFFAVY